jgi:hypothetical protein
MMSFAAFPGDGTTTLARDALALIKRSLEHERRRRSAKLRPKVSLELPVGPSHPVGLSLTYLEAAISLWLRAGFSVREIADEQRTSVEALQRLRDRAVRKLMRA